MDLARRAVLHGSLRCALSKKSAKSGPDISYGLLHCFSGEVAGRRPPAAAHGPCVACRKAQAGICVCAAPRASLSQRGANLSAPKIRTGRQTYRSFTTYMHGYSRAVWYADIVPRTD